MAESQGKQVFNRHFKFIYLLTIIMAIIIGYFNWIVGLSMIILIIASILYSLRQEKILFKETKEYISTLSYRTEKVGKEVLLEMPIGIILYDDSFHIEWLNPYMNQLGDEESLVGKSLNTINEDLIPMIKEEKSEVWFQLDDYQFQTKVVKDERLLYLFDKTSQVETQTLYYNEQTVLAIIYLDNYEEITQNMDDTIKSHLNSNITSLLNDWASQYGLYLKRTSQDRFLAVGTLEILHVLEEKKFEILDLVRQVDTEQERINPVTLSIGISHGSTSLPLLGQIAQSSLDLALGRGGDQVAIKDDTGKVRFYGGKTNPMEKRTRVRARVISHALRELVRDSDKVIVMGHKSPDMDSLGAAIGVLNIAKSNDVEGHIVFDPEDNDVGIYRIMQAIKEEEDIWKNFVTPEESNELVTSRTLVVVVDTHKPSMVANPKLLNEAESKVVIDHHRRGEDFVVNPTLVYMEPYASSTAELVTELLEYQSKHAKLKMLEATALLAGIIVDTKSFTLRTGSRTFDAASYLRSKGADTVLVQQFMKEDLGVYMKRSRLIEKAEIYFEKIAIARANENETFDQVLIAQTADTLLTMTGINASFVISNRTDGRVGISARSLGDINVQVIMEKLNGGGHLTNAATQIDNVTTDQAEELLKDVLTEYFEGRNEL